MINVLTIFLFSLYLLFIFTFLQRLLFKGPVYFSHRQSLLHHYRLDVQLPSHSFSLLASKSTGLSSSIEVTGASQQGHVFLPVNHMLTGRQNM
jgi:hypothetical protein